VSQEAISINFRGDSVNFWRKKVSSVFFYF